MPNKKQDEFIYNWQGSEWLECWDELIKLRFLEMLQLLKITWTVQPASSVLFFSDFYLVYLGSRNKYLKQIQKKFNSYF